MVVVVELGPVVAGVLDVVGAAVVDGTVAEGTVVVAGLHEFGRRNRPVIDPFRVLPPPIAVICTARSLLSGMLAVPENGPSVAVHRDPSDTNVPFTTAPSAVRAENVIVVTVGGAVTVSWRVVEPAGHRPWAIAQTSADDGDALIDKPSTTSVVVAPATVVVVAPSAQGSGRTNAADTVLVSTPPRVSVDRTTTSKAVRFGIDADPGIGPSVAAHLLAPPDIDRWIDCPFGSMAETSTATILPVVVAPSCSVRGRPAQSSNLLATISPSVGLIRASSDVGVGAFRRSGVPVSHRCGARSSSSSSPTADPSGATKSSSVAIVVLVVLVGLALARAVVVGVGSVVVTSDPIASTSAGTPSPVRGIAITITANVASFDDLVAVIGPSTNRQTPSSSSAKFDCLDLVVVTGESGPNALDVPGRDRLDHADRRLGGRTHIVGLRCHPDRDLRRCHLDRDVTIRRFRR